MRLPILVQPVHHPIRPYLYAHLPQRRTFLVLAAAALVSSLFVAAAALAQVPPVGATADIRDANGRQVATAEFREGRSEVLITLLFPSPPVLSGTHALHIMQVGRCDLPDFTTAGNIFNPLNRKHGRQNPDGPMIGDLPNVNFTNGLTSYNTSANGATLGQGQASLLGPNRTALVIHAGEDDQSTDPEGKSGARIACGVITAASGLSAQPAASPAVAVAGQPGVPKPIVSPVVAQSIASPVPVQPVQPAQPVQPVQPAQPVQPGVQQPAKPIVSPAVPKPVVAAASPSPVIAAQPPQPAVPVLPTVSASAAAAPATQSSNGGLGPIPALLLSILGVGLVGTGYLLRRRSQLQRR